MNVLDALLSLQYEMERPRPMHPTIVSHQAYREIWDFHEKRGERPWSGRFCSLARRRFARELAASLCLRWTTC
jgi:hypothetical protein